MTRKVKVKSPSTVPNKPTRLENRITSITNELIDSKADKKATLTIPEQRKIERDGKGRFCKGSTGNAGGFNASYKAQVDKFRQDLLTLFSTTNSVKAIQAALEGTATLNKDQWTLIEKIIATLPKQQEVSGIEPHKHIVINVNKAKTPADDDVPMRKVSSD